MSQLALPLAPASAAHLLAIVLVGVTTLAVTPQPPVLARGEDACPEQNDDFQRACYLGPGSDALGFISGPDDVDAYRFETLDQGVRVRVELSEMPAPYAFRVTDWNGRPIGDSTGQGGVQAVDATLGPPGSYYVFVQSLDGKSSDSQPYRLEAQPRYSGAQVPPIMSSENFPSSGNDRTESTVFAPPESVRLPQVSNFTLAVDTSRITDSSQAAYIVILFRWSSDRVGYPVFIDPTEVEVDLHKVTDDGETRLASAHSIALFNFAGGVNRQ